MFSPGVIPGIIRRNSAKQHGTGSSRQKPGEKHLQKHWMIFRTHFRPSVMQKKYPFKFLDAYTPEDIDFYFGRDEEIDIMYNMVFQTNLLLVYGGSGVGKSSLIQCGLASRFNTHDWQSIFVRRGNNINQSLDEALIETGGEIKDNGNQRSPK